jgi:UDP-N-acetylglucosamine--N-acetylmuramyl-(pentapeptide) pyrophosphoryl-undecaprenol N-acetylglucosamine transferase
MIISGGGTGGHIFPAISIANAFKSRFPDAEILFVGAKDRMEMERIPAAGYRIVGLPVTGFYRKKKLRNIGVILKLIQSLGIARRVIRDFRPDVVVGVGGYASGPTLWMASLMGIPTLIQEQNSYAGVTNKYLAKRVTKICVAYEGMERFFPAHKIVLTGNPVRNDLEYMSADREEALNYFQLRPDKKTALVIGGSLGARNINRGIGKQLDILLDAGIQVIWQTGRIYYDAVRQQLEGKDTKKALWYADFISRMDYAYAAADVVVSRAGAGSISELCILKKPAILIPSPNVAENHQMKNAMAIVVKNGAIIIDDSAAEECLCKQILDLINDRIKMQSLSKAIGLLAKHQSAELIVNEIESIIKSKSR